MKRPSFQFYPEDWLANANLRRCTHEEKGIWIDVMCLLHDQAEYGVVRWPLKELAGAVGTTARKLRALIDKGVLKGADTGESTEAFIYVPRSGRRDGDPVTLIDEQKGPLWFSSRMVTDEYKRQVRGGELPSPKGGLGEVLDAAPKPAPSTRAPAQAPRAAPPSPSPTPLTSPSLRSGEGAAKPQRPPGRKRSEARTLATYLAECRAAKVKPVPDDHAVRRWAADAGLTPDMLQIAWVQFRERYTEGEKGKGKRYRDWPAHFATAVKDNWFRLWFTDDKGGMCWSSNGMTHKAVLDARAAQQEVEHEPA